MAEECLKKAQDLSGLLLLHTAKGSAAGLAELVEAAGAQNRQNVVFLCQLLLGDLHACVDLLLATGRIPEAAFFARTYLPSRMTEACSHPPHYLVCFTDWSPRGYDSLVEALLGAAWICTLTVHLWPSQRYWSISKYMKLEAPDPDMPKKVDGHQVTRE